MKVRTAQPKRPLNLFVEEKLLAQAKNNDINLSAVFENALRHELGKLWQKQNSKAIAAYNERIEKEGLWCDKYRTW
jgi:antitoxin CcdA